MKLQKLGIEIRKIGNVESLYKDVDRVLNQHEIPVNSINVNVQVQTTQHALHKMIALDNHFSVCTIRECASLCGIVISGERMKVYSSIHCINWNDMLPEYRQMIVAMILDDFRGILQPINQQP